MSFVTQGVCEICGGVVYTFDGIDDKTQENAAVEAATLATVLHMMGHGNGSAVDRVKTSWTMEAPDVIQRRKEMQDANAVKLFEMMSEWCKAHHDTPWWERAPVALWRRCLGYVIPTPDSEDDLHDVDDGRADTSPEELAAMMQLATKARGWWVVIQNGEPVFVPLATWELVYNAQVTT